MDGEDDWLVRAADREIAGGNQDADSISFEDSERFEGDSDGDSFGSMSDGLNWDWRDAIVPHEVPYMLKGYAIPKNRLGSEQLTSALRSLKGLSGTSSSLAELAARTCAKHLAFYQVEHIYRSINVLKRNKLHPYTQDVEHLPVSDTLPDTLFLKIAYHCFPANLDDTRLYSVMASGKSENFNHGAMLYQNGYVSNVVQIGYLISANVQDEVLLGSSKTYSVSIKVDRCRVIFSKCSCEDHCEWCSHVCALINFRLHEPHRVQYRVTIWDAINELDDNKLKKFAQYLINELPREHLPMAQRLLDQLSDPNSEINNSYGAPDPTDGGHEAIAVMTYNEPLLHDMFRRQLQSFCMKQNLAHAIDELSSTRHSSSQEFHRHLQPFVNLDPAAMQNFIVMIKSMLQRKDPNAISLIRVATEECIANRLVLLHWYCYKLVQSGRWQMISDDTQSRQLNIGQLCDELVNLWRGIALNPAADRSYREQLFDHLQRYHNLSADRIFKIIKSSCVEDSLVGSFMSTIVNQGGQTLSAENARFTIDCFPGFYPAMNVCQAMQSFEIQGISIEPFHAWLKWPEQTVELLPEPIPQSPQRKNSTQKKKKSKRRTGRRGNQGPSRRLQREESSESGQESDQEDNQAVFPAGDVAQVLAACHSPLDPLETRFAQCEAASVHGYAEHAIPMAMDLMKSVLSHVETYNELNLPSTSWTASQNNFEQLHNSTLHRIETLEKTNLISRVLLKSRDRLAQSQLFAFLVKILLCSKFPMTSKHAQVKEHHLENELLTTLQSIEITETEVVLMRECAERIREIVECEEIPPIGLAKFIFEELSYSNYVVKFEQYRTMGTYESQSHPYRANQPKRGRVPEDDDRALAAAVNSLGVRIPISDLDYPMLSESIRFSKGNLAITLLVSFKEDQEKLGIILDRLLDPRIHQLKYFCNSLFFLKDACNKRKYFPGQRPHFPYESKKKKEEQQDQCPIRTEEEVALKKLMSTSVLNQHKQQESKKSVIHVSKGKRLKTRFLANATDAFSTFMFDLGKRVLAVAGGNPNTIFNHVPGGGIQRNLHICSLLINLYGLGVLNKGKKTNWILRNYSSEVSWIQQQISEIGQAGYEIVREIYWEFHFTPSEMAQLSEKAIQAGHVDADRQACLLSLAILPYAQMLSVPEIRGAIARCKEHSSDDLEKACDGIIRAHDHTGDISADILFQCAHHYEDLWKEKEKELNLRKASGQVPQLQHMASYPGAPRVYMNQNPYMRRMVTAHPTPPVFNPMQAPGFPQYPESSSQLQLAPDYSNQAGLHQSHSAPQLSNSCGAAASSRQYVSRLIKAYTAGTHAMGAHMRQYEEAVKQNQQRIPMYKDDMIWFTDFVLHNLSLETSFDFFENAYKAISCPFTLLHIASKCYQINYMYNQQDAPLPAKINHSTPLLPPEFVHNTVRLSLQQNVPSLQSLLTQPPPKLSMLRQHLTYQLLANKPFHPVTMDLLEKCYDSFAHAISRRLNFSSFSDMDRMEAEHIFKGFLKLVSMIPLNQSIVEMFMHHARKCKHFRSVLPKKDANSVVHGDPQVRQLLTQFTQSAPPAPFSQHYQNHY